VNHQQAGRGESRQAETQRGRVDLVSVLFVVCGIPSMIAFFLILFLLTGACDQTNTLIPA
jgi:hypothetical protein